MFRIADGEPLGYDDPPARGHSIEFRINAEDPGRGFLPAPGPLTRFSPPSGPGVRLDAGYQAGMSVPQAYDSLIAKLVITGATRRQALQRAARALAEFQIEGMPTVLPFHRAVVAGPAFTAEPFTVHTRWIETEFDASTLPAQQPAPAPGPPGPPGRDRLTVEVGGKRLEVTVPGRAPAAPTSSGRPRRASRTTPAAPSGDTLISPMQGTINKIVVADGQQVTAGDIVVVLEAMKMEQPLTAHKDGIVSGLAVTVGQSVTSGEKVCQIEG
jgi:acetyl-CoA/propionyl-CoA carboxylase biotin carboxyl carrier protein